MIECESRLLVAHHNRIDSWMSQSFEPHGNCVSIWFVWSVNHRIINVVWNRLFTLCQCERSTFTCFSTLITYFQLITNDDSFKFPNGRNTQSSGALITLLDMLTSVWHRYWITAMSCWPINYCCIRHRSVQVIYRHRLTAYNITRLGIVSAEFHKLIWRKFPLLASRAFEYVVHALLLLFCRMVSRFFALSVLNGRYR